MSYITYEVEVDSVGNTFWFLNNERHREDGPAISWADGSNHWFLNNVEYTEEEFNRKMSALVGMPKAPEVGMPIDEMEKILGRKVNMLNLEHKWLKTLLRRSPTVGMTIDEMEKVSGKKVKMIK